MAFKSASKCLNWDLNKGPVVWSPLIWKLNQVKHEMNDTPCVSHNPVSYAYSMIAIFWYPAILICWNMMTINYFYGAGFCLFLSCMCSVCSPSAVSCVVSEWTQWSGCAEPCRATVRRRSRTVLQEPLNAGKPCPHLEEHAGCAEYWTHHGHCHNSLGEKKKKLPGSFHASVWSPQYSLIFSNKNHSWCNNFMLLYSPPHSSPAWRCWCMGGQTYCSCVSSMVCSH